MRLRADAGVTLLLAAAFALGTGCSRPMTSVLEVGRHRVRLTPPANAEHLDHGRQHLFGTPEMELSLTDLGPTPSPPADTLRYALGKSVDMRRREIASESKRTVGGSVWTEVETWDRVTHADRKHFAVLDNQGYLLALSTERGPIQRTGPVFEALLTSIELTREEAPPPK